MAPPKRKNPQNPQQRAWEATVDALRSGSDPGVLIERLEGQAEERDEEARILYAQAEAFRDMANAVRVLSGRDEAVREPDAPPGFEWGHTLSTPERPAGMDAIRIIMREGGIWNTRKLMEELSRRGWEFSNARSQLRATEAALGRLHTVKGEIERVGRGQYRYKQEWPGSPPASSGVVSAPTGAGKTSSALSPEEALRFFQDALSARGAEPDRPRGREAIRRIVQDASSSKVWTPKVVAAELEERGWSMSTGAIHNQLSALAAERELERVGVGRYRRGPRFREVTT